MDNTSIKTSSSQTGLRPSAATNGAVPTPPPPESKRSQPGPIKQLLAPFASLRLTVALFVLALILVLAGTLAQMDLSNQAVVTKYFRSAYVWIPFKIFFPRGDVGNPAHWYNNIPGGFPFPGGWTIGAALLVNLLAAHAVRFKLTWKRSGIIVLHSGLILMMLGELITGLFAVESSMTIVEGSSSNFVENRDKSEIVITTPSKTDPTIDDVVAIPAARLRKGGVISDAKLPFDLVVEKYFLNSDYIDIPPGEGKTPATKGEGLRAYAIEKPETTGTASEQTVNIPSAYVTFKNKKTGESLGTYLVSVYPAVYGDPPQQLDVDGATYSVALRFQRTYKPYTFRLKKFTNDVYPGTEIPKDYASLVQLQDPSRGENREVRIWMNHPLRYEGETFYQADFLKGSQRGTILQVVRNPGWTMPYLACAMVALGMVIHFGITLIGFIRVKALPSLANRPSSLPNGRRNGTPLTPPKPTDWTTVGVSSFVAVGAVLYMLVAMTPPSESSKKFHFQEAGKIAVTDGGRSKPLDSVARNDLMIISGKQTFLVERFMVSDTSLQSLAALSGDETVPQPLLVKLQNLKDKEMYREEFVRDLSKVLDESEQERFEDVVLKHSVLDKKEEHTAMEWLLDVMTSRVTRNAKAAHYKVFRIDSPEVLNLLGLEERPGSYRYSLAEIWTEKNSDKLEHEITRAEKVKESEQKLFDTKVLELASHLRLYQELESSDKPLVIDPPGPGQQPISFKSALKSGMDTPQVLEYTAVLKAYSTGDVEGFNAALADYHASQVKKDPARLSRADFEAWFNSFAPFYHCLGLYIVVVLLSAVSWLGFRKPLNGAAFWLMLVIYLFHTAALIARIYIQEKPPVTNLYSSAIFIGWVAVGILLVVEWIFPYSIATFLGGIIGFATLFLAHYLSLDGDTMEMMRAVLDTNFWLATHVTSVTIGYGATFVAGFLGLLYIGASIYNTFTGKLDRDLFTIIAGYMLYGVVCFAMLFSFTGTVLGGIWADQSWGRFWGWDAKENGALLIVIWNALILHARWGGLVKARGMAGLAVFGNVITAWSYFGVNMLGVGLHSYGFMHGALAALIGFIAFQMVAIVLCCIPALHRWQTVPAKNPFKVASA